jgi:8-oxo-dGTP diphosphatase
MTQSTQNIDTVVENLLNEGFNPATHGAVVILVKNQEGKYLIMQRSANDEDGRLQWDLPGGSCDTNMVAQDAARELEEEAGFKTEELTFVHHSKYICPWKSEEKVSFVFSHETSEDFQLSFEHDDAAWVTPEEIMEYDFYKSGLQELVVEHAKQA